MNIIQATLSNKCYVNSFSEKKNIVIHGSFSRTKYSSASYSAGEQDIVNRWNMLEDKSAGHYAVGRSGNIYKCVDEANWSSHLKLNKKMYDLDKRGIAVFLINELYLTKNNGKHYAFGLTQPQNIYTGPVFNAKFKGQNIWADYDQKQAEAFIELLLDICERHNIPKTMLSDTATFDTRAWSKAGIISHANVNSTSLSLPIPDWFKQKILSAGISFVE